MLAVMDIHLEVKVLLKTTFGADNPKAPDNLPVYQVSTYLGHV